VTIVLNGETRQAPPDTTILALLEILGVMPGRVAVELNGDVLRRVEFGRRTLRDGDRVELVQFVGGG
jgi:sulfur carrier protein